MSRYQRVAFDVAGPFVVRRTFTFNGEMYCQDDIFPVDGVSKRRIRQLYDNRRIDMDDAPALIASAPVPAAPPVAPEVAEVAIRDLPDDELFARAMEATGVRYRVRERAIKALESL